MTESGVAAQPFAAVVTSERSYRFRATIRDACLREGLQPRACLPLPLIFNRSSPNTAERDLGAG